MHHTVCRQIPKLDHSVITTRGYHSWIDRKLRGSHPIGVTFECLSEFALVDVPDFDQLVIWGGYEQRSILVEVDWLNWCRMTIHNWALSASIIVPNSDGCIAGNGCNEGALRVHGHIADGSLMANEFVWSSIGWQAPGQDQTIVGTRDHLLQARVESCWSYFLFMSLQCFKNIWVLLRVDHLILLL